VVLLMYCIIFQAEYGIRDATVTGVQTCALPICLDELVSRHAGLERIGLEVGGNQGEGVVVRRAGGRAGAEIMRQTHQALAAGIRSEERRVGKECRYRWLCIVCIQTMVTWI